MNSIVVISLRYLKKLFLKGNDRSVKAKKNILGSFFFKAGSVSMSLIIVPLTLHYLDASKYGIWLTLISIVGWIEFFDVGLGNGLRNKLSEALVKEDQILAKRYVSTTYALAILIITFLFILFLIVNPFINWSVLLNTSKELNSELKILTLIVATVFSLRFILQLINTIFMANQRPALYNFSNFVSNFLSLIVIYILTLTSKGSLIYLSITLGFYPLVLIILSIIFFKKDYRGFKPEYKFIDFKLAKELTSLGLKFFIIQISSLILFSTDNIIIAHLFGPAEVTSYFIAYKYFGITAFIFAVINAPFWSAYTEAYQKGDIQWIRNINTKLKKIWLLMTAIGLILLLISNYIYEFWVGKDIYIPYLLSIGMFLYFAEHDLASIYLSFVNGIGKLKLQLVFAIAGGILNIPLSIFFAKILGIGVTGVILATFVCLLHGPTIIMLQYKRLINGTAVGIWNK